MKKFDIKDVFSWSNAENAKEYIGKYCYFADTLANLEYGVNENIAYMLQKVCNDKKCQVHEVFRDNDDDGWGLCLPVDKVIEVKEPERWRAYKNFDEFDYAVSDTVHLRLKHKHSSEYIYLITGFNYKENSISINGVMGNFENFFDMYEIFNGNEWQPFGVRE